MKLLKWILAAAACALAIHVANAQTPPKPGATPIPSAVNDVPTKAFEELFNEASFDMWPGGQIGTEPPIVWNPWGKTDGTTWWKPSLCTGNNYLLSGGAGAQILSLNTSNADCNANNQGWYATGIGTAAWNSGGAGANGLSTGFLAKPPCYWEFGVWIPSLGPGDAVATTGLWPSISLYTDPGQTTENIEYDVFEMYSGEHVMPTDRTYPFVHTTWHNYKSGASNGIGTTENSDISGAWHTWGIWIDAATTHWYLDGTELWNAPTQGTTNLYAVIANALGGGWAQNINKANTYTMKLSYVDCWTGSGGTTSTPGTFVQSQVTTQSASSSTTAVTLSAEKAGDLNVLLVGNYNGANPPNATVSSITSSAGNVYTLASGPVTQTSQGPMYVYYSNGVSAGSDAITVNWSSSTAFTEVIAAEYSNTGAVQVENQTTATSASGSSLSIGPVSNSTGDLVVTSYRNSASTTAQVTYPSGYTSIGGTSSYNQLASKTNVSSGSQTVSWSSTQTGQELGAIVAFKFVASLPPPVCTVVQSGTSSPYPANTTSLNAYLNNPLGKGDNISISAKDGSGNPLAITSASDNAGIGDTYATTGGNNSTWQTTNSGGISGTNWGGANFTAGFASTNSPQITVTECTAQPTPSPSPPPVPQPVLPANTLPASYHTATTGPAFNEDFSSNAYKPGQGPCAAIADPLSPITAPAKWSTHKSPPYPCSPQIPFGNDSNGNFGIWTHAPITGFTSDGGGIHSCDSSGSGEGFTDGYYEALVHLPTSSSINVIHPVLWGRWDIVDNGVLQTVNNPEIDWMEYGTAETSSTAGSYGNFIHIWNSNTNTVAYSSPNISIPAGNGYNGMGSGWHVFGMWVQPANTPGGASVIFYLDGAQKGSWSITDSSLHAQPIGMRISMGQDVAFDGTPRELAVRYMRVWSQ